MVRIRPTAAEPSSMHHHQTIVVTVTGDQVQVPRTNFPPFLSEPREEKCPMCPIEIQVRTLTGTPRALQSASPSRRDVITRLSTCSPSGGWLALMARV